VENLSLQVFQKYFFLVSIALSLQTMKTNFEKWEQVQLKDRTNIHQEFMLNNVLSKQEKYTIN